MRHRRPRYHHRDDYQPGALVPGRRPAFVLLLVATSSTLLSCSDRAPTAPSGTEGPPRTTGPSQPANDPPRCTALRQRFAETIAAAPRTCAQDTDCSKYWGGYGDCGGVVDRASAATLAGIYQELRAEPRCELERRCAPQIIRPRCHEGRCINRPLARPSPNDP